MEPAASPEEAEIELAELLISLANPSRLALLRQLRSPRALGEIRVRAEQPRDGLSPDRAMSRQAVRAHLDRLLESGFARARRAEQGGSPSEEYLVNHLKLFGLAEELRQLAQLRPTDVWNAETTPLGRRPEGGPASGPQLVIVHGLGEGRAFLLGETDHEGWTIGRRWGLPISLDYDPYVSQEHARIVRQGAGFAVEDLPSSRNGVTLNWTPLAKGSRAPLAHGDVLGVGRSLLLFRHGNPKVAKP